MVRANRAIIPLFLTVFTVVTLSAVLGWQTAGAQYRARAGGGSSGGASRAGGGGGGGGSVYPQFRSGSGTIRWIPDQMPLKVYVAPGLTLDGIVDPQVGAPYTRVENKDHWPDLVAGVVANQQQFQTLGLAEGFTQQQMQAAIAGINSWKPFEREGLFSFQVVDNPADADIFVFWTAHFVDKLGMALFQKDIRGYTAKRSFWYKQIMSGKQAQFRPVVILLRTTEDLGSPMPPNKMQASAAHEFGHALGIEGHSTNAADLMSVNYGRGVISPNDAATIRYLYHQTPDLIP